MRKYTFAIVLLVMGGCSNENDPVTDAKKYCRCIEKAKGNETHKMNECIDMYNEVIEKYEEQEEKLEVAESRMRECSIED